MNKRQSHLLEILNVNNKIEVAKLAELLNVSQVTVRKDLDLLEEKGLLHREHGFAVLKEADDINSRLSVKYNIKRKIAKEASKLVSSGETIMIESGSTCALLAEELAYNTKDVTIITNSAFISSYIREAPFCKVILLGGDYQKESQVTVGPLVREYAKKFHVDKIFLGTDGFSEKSGFTGSDLMRTEASRNMAKSAKNIVILTTSDKFSQQGVVSQFKADEVQYVYTDSGISTETKSFLEDNKVIVNII